MPRIPRKYPQLYVIFWNWRQRQTQLSIPASSERLGLGLSKHIPSDFESILVIVKIESGARQGQMSLAQKRAKCCFFPFHVLFSVLPGWNCSKRFLCFFKNDHGSPGNGLCMTLQNGCFLTSSVVEKQEIRQRLAT